MIRRIAALTCVFCAVTAATASARPRTGSVRLSFLVPAKALAGLVPANLQGYLTSLRPAAARAVAAQHGTVAKANALRDVVRAGMPVGTTSCFGYAVVMAALGRQLGLPVRLVAGTDGLNGYDTHTTVGVWSAALGRWVISDPTLGGTFVDAATGQPLGVTGVRDALVTGTIGGVDWSGSGRKNATLPSQYYVDPTYLLRYVGAYAWVDGRVKPAVLPDSTMLSSGVFVVGERALATSPPSAQIAASPAGVSWTAARPVSLQLPPSYAPTEVWAGAVSLPATITVPPGSLAVWVSDPTAVVDGYTTTPVDGGGLSPIFVSGTFEVDGTGTATVRVFAARHFPLTRER